MPRPRFHDPSEIERLADRFMRSRRRSPAITLTQYLQDPDHYELEHTIYLTAWQDRDVHILDRKVHLN